MKIVLTTLNAKYIHTSLGLRWLYVVNKERFNISFREYTIKEDIDKVVDELLSLECDVVGISVSIWNVSSSRILVESLKKSNPNIIIILGGPEVTYEPDFFINNWNIDYVVSGEGEFVLGELLNSIQNKTQTEIDGVSSKNYISKTVVQADPKLLSAYPSPYQLEEDKADLKNRLVYFETSRGCPYQCQYCLSSLEKGVRYFPENFITENLLYLIKSGAKQIKFLDRTFNLNKEHTSRIFNFLIKNYRSNLSCQFEIYADLLTDETIDYLNINLPEKYFRFEIGIQSTYEPTNIAVKRKQDFPLLAENIKKIMDGKKIDLHLDLIAGLPFETFDRFVKSFNDVFELGAKEVQLGFLKLLRGTNLRRYSKQYGYKYNEEAPYDIICNDAISQTELERIYDAEHALEKFWNSGRFTKTMNLLFQDYYGGRYFELFDEIGQFYKSKQYPNHGYQLEDIFRYLNEFLLSKGINIFETLRDDYYSNFSRRPQGFWDDVLGKEKRKKLLYTIGQDKTFLKSNDLTRKIIEKLTTIEPITDNVYLLTIFMLENNVCRRLQIKYELKENLH